MVARALREMIERLEKKKYGVGVRTRESTGAESTSPRSIPAEVRWAVRQRDGDRCTFVSDSGRRCEARTPLEYDHVVPVARGGPSTVSNLRLRCRGHNQLEAERAFGSEFMKWKRAAAKAERREAAEAMKPFDGEVVCCLRRLGLRADEAQAAAASSGASPEARIEERVRAALKWFGGGRRKVESEPQQLAKAG